MRLTWIALLVCTAIAGCGNKELSFSSTSAPAPAPAQSAGNAARYLAYEHSVGLDVADSRVASVHAEVEAACKQAVEQQCVILHSQLSTGSSPSAELKLRAKPEGIRALIASLRTHGKLMQQSLTAEDLAGPIEDGAKKLAMLKDYRTQLEALQKKADSDIDALIKVSKELAQTQSEIEAMTGQQAHLMKRVQTELLNISIASLDSRSMWHPVSHAMKDFGGNLSHGLSSVITAAAFLLPWSILLIVLGWGARRLWRMRKR